MHDKLINTQPYEYTALPYLFNKAVSILRLGTPVINHMATSGVGSKNPSCKAQSCPQGLLKYSLRKMLSRGNTPSPRKQI